MWVSGVQTFAQGEKGKVTYVLIDIVMNTSTSMWGKAMQLILTCDFLIFICLSTFLRPFKYTIYDKIHIQLWWMQVSFSLLFCSIPPHVPLPPPLLYPTTLNNMTSSPHVPFYERQGKRIWLSAVTGRQNPTYLNPRPGLWYKNQSIPLSQRGESAVMVWPSWMNLI